MYSYFNFPFLQRVFLFSLELIIILIFSTFVFYLLNSKLPINCLTLKKLQHIMHSVNFIFLNKTLLEPSHMLTSRLTPCMPRLLLHYHSGNLLCWICFLNPTCFLGLLHFGEAYLPVVSWEVNLQ